MLQFYIPEVVAVEQIFDEADEVQVGKLTNKQNFKIYFGISS